MDTTINDPELFFNIRPSQEKLERLFVCVINLLERDPAFKYRHVDSAQVILVNRLRHTLNTYFAIVYLCTDTAKYSIRRKEFVFAVAPLVRVLFEELIVIIFFLHNVPMYIPYYLKTSYWEDQRELDHTLKYYSGISEWDGYADKIRNKMQMKAKAYQLTPDEIANPKKNIGFFPQGNGLIKKLKNDYPVSPAIPFLEFIVSWIYRYLSGQTHLDVDALTEKSVHFSRDDAKQVFGEESYQAEREKRANDYFAKQVWIVMTVMLSIVTEIDFHFKYDLKERASELWNVFAQHSFLAEKFYEMRYARILNNQMF